MLDSCVVFVNICMLNLTEEATWVHQVRVFHILENRVDFMSRCIVQLAKTLPNAGDRVGPNQYTIFYVHMPVPVNFLQ